MTTLLFYCQHSLGMGHFVRSAALAERLAASFHVVFINGGPLPEGVQFPERVQRVDLPALSMHEDRGLVSLDATLSVAAALERRRDIMLDLLRTRRPSVLVIELFPFGRRKFEPELIPLLEAAHAMAAPRPRVVCSVRDLLVTSRAAQQGFDDRAQGVCDRYFDLVLVHADPSFAAFEDSFHPASPLRVPVRYTGFVARSESVATNQPPRREGLIVSAGGGIVGEPLFRAAVEAHRINWPTLGLPTTIVAGPFAPPGVVSSLVEAATTMDGLRVLSHVPDLGEWLRSARASVSQCGYNTMLDVVRSGVPALVVPFATDAEDEQSRRAQRLADMGMVRWLDPRALTPARLAPAVEALLDFEPAVRSLSLDGAATSARMLSEEVISHARV
jgi:predicted glycosyltransferase